MSDLPAPSHWKLPDGGNLGLHLPSRAPVSGHCTGCKETVTAAVRVLMCLWGSQDQVTHSALFAPACFLTNTNFFASLHSQSTLHLSLSLSVAVAYLARPFYLVVHCLFLTISQSFTSKDIDENHPLSFPLPHRPDPNL